MIYAPETPGGKPDFQAHHQPFNYYARLDPETHPEARAAHLKDYEDLLADVAAGGLPAVTFYKPQGNFNQHAGYASVEEGDEHIAALVAKLRASPQWPHMLIVITYDEFGGAWDHVAPPQGDLLGPGARIPALIVSPYSRRGSVDHTQYDTESILRLITRRFDLNVLPGIKMRDRGLAAHGSPPWVISPTRLNCGVSRYLVLGAYAGPGAAVPGDCALINSTSNINSEPAGILGLGCEPYARVGGMTS